MRLEGSEQWPSRGGGQRVSEGKCTKPHFFLSGHCKGVDVPLSETGSCCRVLSRGVT